MLPTPFRVFPGDGAAAAESASPSPIPGKGKPPPAEPTRVWLPRKARPLPFAPSRSTGRSFTLMLTEVFLALAPRALLFLSARLGKAAERSSSIQACRLESAAGKGSGAVPQGSSPSPRLPAGVSELSWPQGAGCDTRLQLPSLDALSRVGILGFFSYAGSSSEWFKDKQGRWEQQSNSKGGLDEAWRNLGQWEVSLPKGGGWKETIFNPNNSRIP